MKQLELSIPPVIQVILTALGMWAVSYLLPEFDVYMKVAIPIGGALFLIGITIAFLGVLAFRKANTTVDPRFPDKSSRLVVTGVYRISRNPMYLGFLFMLSGFAFYLMNFAAFLLLPLFVVYMNRFQIKLEEQYMLQKFEEEFNEYAEKVRRWL